MSRIDLILSGGDSRHDSLDVSAQSRINWMPERQNYDGAVSEWILVDCPSTSIYMSVASGTVRGMYKAGNGSLYVAKGENIYEIHDRTGTMTVYDRGTLGTNTSRVYMADNGTHVAIVDGNNMFLHEMGANADIFGQSIPFSNPTHIVFSNSYLICNSAGGTLEEQGRFWYSGIFDATTWSALAYANAEGFSDPIIAIAVRRGELCLFGSESLELYGPTGDSNNPFARIGASQLGIGCRAKYSPAEIGGQVFWVGSSKSGADTVYTLNGYEAQPISDITISQRLGNPIDAIGWTYSVSGHTCYVLNLQGDDTWVFDLTTGKWHRRQGRNADGSPRSWKATYSEYHDGKTIVGFEGLDSLCYLDTDSYVEADTLPMVRTFRSNNIVSGGKRLMHKSLSVYMDTGRITDYSKDPQVMMRYSNDGGYTWSKSRWQSLGKTGRYNKPIKWSMLGASSERVYELQVSDNAKCTLMGGFVDVEMGLGR